MTTLRIATRRSQLALTQTRAVAAHLERARPGLRVELVELVTSADRMAEALLRDVGGKALFVKELEEALLDGRCDLAVHSCKDLPTLLPEGLGLLAVPPREAANDVLIAREPGSRLQDLPEGARVGTNSLRRKALLLRQRPDLRIVALRGNVDTRLRKLRESGELDAVVVAEAGLLRLGLSTLEREALDPERFVPAAGQGALAVEARSARDDLSWVRQALEDPASRLAVEAERAFLDCVGGSCHVPVGAWARWRADRLLLTGCLAYESGDVIQRSLASGALAPGAAAEDSAAALGRTLAERLLLAGGASVVALYGDVAPAPEPQADGPRAPGTVYLVGAGPGDAGLITRRGEGLLRCADAVVYDNLSNDDLLTPINPAAERYYVGKQAGSHSRSQAEIDHLLVELAGRLQTVVRLKGGDPFIFGRGGEEAEALSQAGIPFEIVPGVTSALAAPAYAGVPLTHRELASSVGFVTGHRAADGRPGVDWRAVAELDTLVILMGAASVRENMQALLEAGRDPNEPVLVVEWGSFPRQRTLLATVSSVAHKMAERGLGAPAVIVVGKVADLHSTLDWFHRRPLFGKRVLVTRSRQQASRLSLLLFQAGAVPVELPSIEVCPVNGEARDRLRNAVLRGGEHDWVVFTSPNGVQHALSVGFEAGADARAFAGARLATIGTTTAEALRRYGLVADLVPERFQAEGLLEALTPLVAPGDRVLILRAAEARPVLGEGLAALGVQVDDVPAYFTRVPEDLDSHLEVLDRTPADLITFASTKTVRNLVQAVKSHSDKLLRIPAACIGPVTRRAASECGFDVVVQPPTYTVDALVAAIAEWAALSEGGAAE